MDSQLDPRAGREVALGTRGRAGLWFWRALTLGACLSHPGPHFPPGSQPHLALPLHLPRLRRKLPDHRASPPGARCSEQLRNSFGNASLVLSVQ